MSLPPTTVLGESAMTAPPAGVPAKIGRFTVLRELGRGGMGVVYSAYDEELDRRVAIKLLHGGPGGEQQSIGQARLLREAQAMARVAHPNVAAIYEVGLVRGQVFIAMELVHGQTLRAWLAAGTRSRQEIVGVYLQAARGLLAAHERGIIHRDFKPENALIGDDGRVRVLDFSLARSAVDEPTQTPSERELPLGDVSLTHAGRIVGTPAYMPPEQALGVVVDGRADQFSFCVALFEALYGQRPFIGQSSGELVEDMLRDRVTPPNGVRLPAWLSRAVLRGLKPSPEQRWPDMAALVAELERDRGRWLRLASALALAAVLAGLVLGALELRARWQRDAVVLAAAERLAVLETSLDQALADGRRTEAAAALAAFTGAPEHRDTPALAAAYLGWSRRMHAASDLDAARLAAAQAYAAASDDVGVEAALQQLALLFRAQGAWGAAALLVADLRIHRPALLERPAWISTAAHAARRRRDLGEFAVQAAAPGAPAELAELAPVVASLSHGTATKRLAERAFAVAGGDTLALIEKGDDGVALVRRDPALGPVGRVELPGFAFAGFAPRLRPDDPALLLAHRAEPPEVAVLALAPEGTRELLRFASARPLSGAVADLDGDGTPSLYLGTGPYSRELLALTPDAAGGLQLGHPHPGTDAAHSDLQAMFTTDLDGDGRDELVVSAGPWNAFDLRVYRAGARAPELALVARRKFGQLVSIGALPGGDGRTRIVAAKIDQYPSRFVFPPETPTGEPAGLYVLELRGDRLEVVAHHPWPVAPGQPVGVSMFGVGDVDGDGRVDPVATLSLGDDSVPLVVVYRQLASGALAAVDIAGIAGLMLGQFDRDPAVELLARVMPDDPAEAAPLWVLGAGDTPVPPLSLSPPEAVRVPAGADPLVARTWARAEQLAGLGLLTEAAQTISGLASLAHTPEVSDDTRLRAADLYRRADQCERATALYLQLGERHAVAALQGLGDCHEREGRFAEALADIDALRARGDLDPALRAALAERAEHLRPGSAQSSLELPLDGRLDPGWRIVDPTALRQDLVTGGLAIDAIVNHGELARLPLRCDGQALALRAELTVERSEWASGFEIAVRRAGATEDTIDLAVVTGGGGGVFERSIRCGALDESHTMQVLRDTPPDTSAAYTLEVEYRPALERLVCAVTGSDGVRRSQAFSVPARLPAGDCELVLRAPHIGFDSVFWTRVRLDALRLGGASLAPARREADAGLLLVQGDAHGALARLDAAGPGDPLRSVWRAMALAELGRWQAAASELQAARLEPGTPAWHALSGLLRMRVASFGPLTRGALGDGAFRLHAAAFVGVLRNHADDPRVQRTLAEPLSDPSEYTPEPGDRQGLLLRTIFHLYRARMWIAAGALDRAEVALAAGIADLEQLGPTLASELPLYIRPAVLGPTLAAARGDPEATRASIRDALRGEPAPEILLDVMRLQPRLRPLIDAP
jgi:predicted Ser/Thr protein kinase